MGPLPKIRGRSPRARRSRACDGRGSASTGSISASAEEPAPTTRSAAAVWVDLRERGGAITCRAEKSPPTGRSPRARRSPLRDGAEPGRRGSISASAEEPWSPSTARPGRRVDLRERGGADLGRTHDRGRRGRSPRARRSHCRARTSVRHRGSISASAEEPRRGSRTAESLRVDLRERGGAALAVATASMVAGRSPRARRSRAGHAANAGRPGSISASAEEPRGARASRGLVRVDLRERGGARPTAGRERTESGRSPRARRSPRRELRRRTGAGSISASAEEPGKPRARTTRPGVDLRERGGAVVLVFRDDLVRGRSPRARRSLGPHATAPSDNGSISASAEEPRWPRRASRPRRVDLRERGGARSTRPSRPRRAGRSPRARRSRMEPRSAYKKRGSISASAEEPHAARGRRLSPGVDLRERGGAYRVAGVHGHGAGRSPRARRSRDS